MQRLVLQKRGKGNEVSVLNVSATGLSLCTEQRVDFVWEMGDWELTLYAVSLTQQISSLVLICDAKTWSLKKEKGNEVSVLYVLATGLSSCADQRVDSEQEMGVLELTLNRVSFTQRISSLVSICDAKTWSQKKRKRKCNECVDCFGHWTVFMRWTESGLCVRDGWLRADPQKSQSHPTNLLLSLYLLDAYTWSHKKIKENVGQIFRFQQLWLSSFKANLSFAAF